MSTEEDVNKKYYAIKLRKFNRLCPITGYKPEANKIGTAVIVQTDRGLEFGQIYVSAFKIGQRLAREVKLKKVIRYATSEDIKKEEQIPEMEAKAVKLAEEKIKEHELPISVIDVEYLFDTNRAVVYYKALKEKKLANLRDLARDLSGSLKARVDLNQVSPRDKARMVGGLGPCSRNLCCASWLDKPKHVTVKMVKEQGLAISPTKTAGMCGRLMCCLEYEHQNKDLKGG